MRHELVTRRGWLTKEEYNRYWALSKLAPGINLIAQVVLYGRYFAGWLGIIASVVGFLLPSVLVTMGLSAGLVALTGNSLTQAAVRVVVPVTGAMTIANALQMWNPQIEAGRLWRTALEGTAVVICALSVIVVHIPVPVVLVAAIVIGALVGWS